MKFDDALKDLSESVLHGTLVAASMRVRAARKQAKKVLDKHDDLQLTAEQTIEQAFRITLDALKDLDALLGGAVHLIALTEEQREDKASNSSNPEMN